MNQLVIAHIATEILVIGGVTFYFTRRHNRAEQQIRDLEQKVQDLETKLSKQKSQEKHIQTLYEMIEGLEARLSSVAEPPRARSMGSSPLRNRKSKMKVVELPPEEEEEVREPPPEPMPSSMPQGFANMFQGMASGMNTGFNPMDALFGMNIMGGGNPLEILVGGTGMGPPPSAMTQPPPSVEIEEEDDSDIKEELSSLGIISDHTHSQ